MFLRLRNRRQYSCHGRMDEERLLPAVELHDYPKNAFTNASQHAYDASESDTSTRGRTFQIHPYKTLALEKLQRITTPLKFEKIRNRLGALTRRSSRHSRIQWVISQDSEELAGHEPVTTSSKTPLRKKRETSHLRRAKHHSRSDAGLRSTVNWYFWSPEAGKNCPSVEFLRIHLAPANVWL